MIYFAAYLIVALLVAAACGYLASSARDEGGSDLAIFIALFWPAWLLCAVAFGPFAGLYHLGKYLHRRFPLD